MFDSEIKNIASILSKFLGEPKDDYSFDTWSHWNCPCCAERKGVTSDNKYNLEINIRKNVYHCWVCGDTDGTKGKLSNLIKKYGNNEIYKEYINELREIKQSSLYQFYKDEINIDELNLVDDITLPYGYTNFTDKLNFDNSSAIEYLNNRGIDKSIINKYKIGYIGNKYNKDIFLKNRIVVPSYDLYGNLNYWVARDYTNKSKLRYKNPHLEKTKFIFNEYLINWYEDITLVEGVFDHIVVPNSIPLLGKTLTDDYYLFNVLISKAMANVNIFLDPDAIKNAHKIYKLLDSTNLKNRIRMITTPSDFDASDIYKMYGYKGILSYLNNAKKLNNTDLIFN